MSFRLRIPGRDEAQVSPAANVANPLIDSASVSRLAELAAPPVCAAANLPMKISGLATLADGASARMVDRATAASLPSSLRKYSQTTIMLTPDAAALAEEERRTRRRARIIWLGYVEVVDELAEALTARDRRLDERRLCVECTHAGPRWHCRKKQGFLIDVLQRCKYFEEGC